MSSLIGKKIAPGAVLRKIQAMNRASWDPAIYSKPISGTETLTMERLTELASISGIELKDKEAMLKDINNQTHFLDHLRTHTIPSEATEFAFSGNAPGLTLDQLETRVQEHSEDPKRGENGQWSPTSLAGKSEDFFYVVPEKKAD